MVHTRDLGDKTCTFIVSGKLWRNSLVMQDVETGSLWSHITGEALDGPLRGQHLSMIPAVQTTWERWVKKHPATKVLKKESEILGSRYESYFSDPERTGLFRAVWLTKRLPGKSKVLGLTSGPHAMAVTEARLERESVVNTAAGDRPLVLVGTSDGGVKAYHAEVRGKRLRFVEDGVPFGHTDLQTKSVWDLDRGVCTGGEHLGAVLDEEIVRLAYWFAWSSFYPNTGVLD